MADSSTKGGVPSNPPASRIPQEQGNVMTFIWNTNTQEFIGRSGSSWAKIGLFYILFYLFLAGFFSILMAVFYSTLSYDQPSYTGTKDSLLKYPGLGIRPYLTLERKKYNLIYDVANNKTTDQFVKDINKLLEPYKNLSKAVEYHNCSWNDGGDAAGGMGKEPCLFDLGSTNTSCNPENRWGYSTTSPCIFLKLNKMIGFLPEPHKNISMLPATLQGYINETGEAKARLAKHVWVWCESEDEGVELEQPSPGLPLVYYPYSNQLGYLAPLAILRIKAPEGKTVAMECKLWASNIPESANGRLTGKANFVIDIINTSNTKTEL